MQNDSALKTLTVAGVLCIICSVLVSTAAVKLKPMQDLNKKLDIKKNLLLSMALINLPRQTRKKSKRLLKLLKQKLSI